MAKISRLILIALTALAGILFGAGTAYAMPAPIEPDTGAGETRTVIEQVAGTTASPLWQFAVIALVAAALAAATVAVVMSVINRHQPRKALTA
jgi:membrane protein DedA with SNARE-associated domain